MILGQRPAYCFNKIFVFFCFFVLYTISTFQRAELRVAVVNTTGLICCFMWVFIKRNINMYFTKAGVMDKTSVSFMRFIAAGTCFLLSDAPFALLSL